MKGVRMKKLFLLIVTVALCFAFTAPALAVGDFEIDANGVLTKYHGSGVDVVIPNEVTSIGNSAFLNCRSLNSVTIPLGVSIISDYAFNWCVNLVSIDIPDSVTYIGDYAFDACSSLTKVKIPYGVTCINGASFQDCYSLKTVIIPDSVTSIEGWAFATCNSLSDIYYGGNETQWRAIKNGKGNTPLTKATIHYNSADAQPTISTPIVNVLVNDMPVPWTDALPFIDANNRTMVPLRAVAEALGLTVDWNGAKREAIFTNGTNTIYFPIGNNAARTGDGGTVQMNTAAVIVNDRTFAPIRYLAEYFGYTVGWDGDTRTVIINPVRNSEVEETLSTVWFDAYKEFLFTDAFLSAGQQYVMGSTDWGTDSAYSVALYDMDVDGIPELKISNGEVSRAGRCAYLYSFDGSKVVYLGIGPTDAFYNTDSRTGIYGYYRMSPDEINCTLYEKDGFSIKTTNKGQYSDITWPKNFVLLYGENIESIRSTGWDVFVSNAGF